MPRVRHVTEASVSAEEWGFPYRGLLQRVLPRGSDEPSADMTLVSTLPLCVTPSAECARVVIVRGAG